MQGILVVLQITILITISSRAQKIQMCANQQHCNLEIAFCQIPYVADCTKYIYCLSDGSASLQSCPELKQFSPTQFTCMDPEAAKCPHCRSESMDATSTIAYCGNQPHCTPELAFTTLPYLSDCTHYIYCDENGTEILRKCPNEYHYSPTENRCTDPDISNCTECFVTTTEFSCPDQPHCTPELAFATLPYIADCRQYIYCDENGTESLRRCPDDNHYSSIETRCMDQQLANCVDCIETTTEFSCPIQAHCTPELAFTTLPNIADCTQYIYCDENGTESMRKCPDDNHYSSTENRCMDQQLANCVDCIETTTEFSCPIQAHCTPELAYTTLPYISDCTQYIYCDENGTESLRKCPGDNHYSSSENRCTDQQLANCVDCIETTTEFSCPIQDHCTPELAFTTLPYVADCTQYIYCDENGTESLRKCPDDNHYSSTENRCMDQQLANCIDCIETTTQYSCPMQPHCSPDLAFTTLPYIADCTQYIYCDENGTESLRKCPEDNHYSSSENRCTNQQLANCVDCIETTTQFSCPMQPHCSPNLAFTTLPYIADCTQYIYCDENGTETLRKCPDDNHYSSTENRCMDQQLASCVDCIETTTQFSCPMQPHCSPNLAFTTLPYIADCTQYIYCNENGTESLRKCPSDYQYSSTENRCIEQELANCVDCIETTTQFSCPDQPHCTSELAFTTLPYIADCTQYIYCDENGTESQRKCPNDFHYSSTENRCIEHELANCVDCIEITTEFSCRMQPHCSPELAFSTLPYITDCTQYIYCDENGTESLRKCPNDFHYSSIENRCIEKELANCMECIETTTEFSCPDQPHCTPELAFTTLTYIADCTQYIYCNENGIESLRKCPNDFHYSSTENRCIEQELANCVDCIEITTEISCPLQPHCSPELAFSTLPYIADCTQYIYCGENGTESIRKCPNDFHYSSIENRCIQRELANCVECIETTTEIYCPDQPHCTEELIFTTLPYINDCTFYIYCEAYSTESLRKCPDLQHYSPSESRCTDPEIAKCPDCTESTTELYCPYQPHCTPDLAYSTLPFITDCTLYVYCELGGFESLRQCPNQEHYSTIKLRCVDPALAQCPQCMDFTTEPFCPEQPVCTPALAFTTLPYIADCSQYVYCSEDGTGSLRTCPDEQYYSPVQMWCTHPLLAECPRCVDAGTTATTPLF